MLNAPTNHIDPLGHDPLDQEWIDTFQAAHGRMPTDENRQDRLFSLIFLGSGPGGTWTDADWIEYGANREKVWSGTTAWEADNVAEGYDRFQLHLERLTSYYGNDRDETTRFTRAVGLVWGGIAFEGSAFLALSTAAVGDHLLQLHEGAAGWKSKYVDDANPAHHWAASYLAGYSYGEFIGIVSNTVREFAQYATGQGGTEGDIHLGNVAASQGEWLWKDAGGPSTGSSPYVVLISKMRRELSVR